MSNRKMVKVNPNTCKWGYCVVDDDVGRRIMFKEEGNKLRLTTHISRALKCGDLVLVAGNEKEV